MHILEKFITKIKKEIWAKMSQTGLALNHDSCRDHDRTTTLESSAWVFADFGLLLLLVVLCLVSWTAGEIDRRFHATLISERGRPATADSFLVVSLSTNGGGWGEMGKNIKMNCWKSRNRSITIQFILNILLVSLKNCFQSVFPTTNPLNPQNTR